MKKFLTPALVLVLLLAVTLPAAARGGGGGGIHLYGTITAIDAAALTITIEVESPLSYLGDAITVQVTSSTILKQCVDDESYRITFEDLVIDQPVRVTGSFVDGVFVASKIIGY